MKRYLLLTALYGFTTTLIPHMAAAQSSGFTLAGKIGHFNAPAKIYFDYTDGEAGQSDSAILVDGAFRFSGPVNGPATVRMVFSAKGETKEWSIYHGDAIYFYIGKENIALTSKDSLANAVFAGSAVYDEFAAFNTFIGGSIMDLDKVANGEYNGGTDEQKKDTAFVQAVDRRFRQSVRNRNDRELVFARQHPGSFFSVAALAEITHSRAMVGVVRPVFDSLAEQWRKSPTGRQLEERMTALTAVVEGSMAPDFTQNDVDGRPVALSSLRGHYVLVDFWASWCSPCRAENPNLKRQYQLYKDKGFQVLSVSLDDNKQKWVNAIAQDGLPWLQVCDLKGWNNDAGKIYGVTGVPASFLVDPQGKIVATRLIGEELDKRLAVIYAE
jgi:peroxiredoxin